MVIPTVLKRRHSLKGVKLLTVVKRIKAGQPESMKEYARIQKDVKTEVLNMDEILKHVRDLTGEDVADILEIADREETVQEARWALYCLIIHANEYGQPKGQDLTEQVQFTDAVQQHRVQLQLHLMCITTKGRGLCQLNQVIYRGTGCPLEKSVKVEKVKELKDKVRTLCLQQDPTDSLILLTVEELAKSARKVNHEEADTLEELARQANRHQKQLDISSLCLSVLGGKAANAITKAISKCLKEKQVESKSEERGVKAVADAPPTPESSPLHNLYPPFMYSMPFQPPYPGSFSQGYNYRNSRPSFRQFGNRPRGACLFCDSQTHQIKDCEKMKAAKGGN